MSSEELQQEIQQEQAELAQHKAQLDALTSGETVWLRHPLTGDVQEVPAITGQLLPWMGRGYQQFTPAAPVKEEKK
jgi:hypothetical protein